MKAERFGAGPAFNALSARINKGKLHSALVIAFMADGRARGGDGALHRGARAPALRNDYVTRGYSTLAPNEEDHAKSGQI